MASILVVSPHCVIKEALATLLVQAGFEVCSLEEAVPDLAVVDLCHEQPPFAEPPPALLSVALVCCKDQELLGLLRLGYRGYLRRRDTSEHLLKAIDVALHGEVWAERSVLVQALVKADPPPLTRRERDVLRKLSSGLSNPEIAEHLGMAVKTVKVHISQLYNKLGAKNRLELSLRGRALVEVEPDDNEM